MNREERVEYRDQDGNLLNEEEVAALEREGKVSFKTKYETRTRLVDADGNEIGGDFAPKHPDAEGQNPETPGKNEGRDQPASAVGKEKSVSKGSKQGKPKPASEGNEATGQ